VQNEFASLPMSLPRLANSIPDRAMYGRKDSRRKKLSLPVCHVFLGAGAHGQHAEPGHPARQLQGPPNAATCIAMAVLLSVRKLLADRQMRHAKKSLCHPATSR
jgi:hypothetical protein